MHPCTADGEMDKGNAVTHRDILGIHKEEIIDHIYCLACIWIV
jgi:hypothetical protein